MSAVVRLADHRARRPAATGYAPGVAPFDSGNPAHVAAWNNMFAAAAAFERIYERTAR